MKYRQVSETCCEAEGVGFCDAGAVSGDEEMLIEVIVAVNKEAEQRFGLDTTILPLEAEFEVRDGFVIVSDVTLG